METLTVRKMVDIANSEIINSDESMKDLIDRLESEYTLEIDDDVSINDIQNIIQDTEMDGHQILVFLDILRRVSMKIQWVEAILASSVVLMSYYHDVRGDPIQTAQIGYRALECVSLMECLSKSDREAQLNMILFNLALSWLTLGRYKKSIALFREALDLSVKRDDKFSMAQIYQNLGVCHRFLEDLFKAKECYFAALKLYKNIDDPHKIKCENNLKAIEIDIEMHKKNKRSRSGLDSRFGPYKPEIIFPVIPFRNRDIDECPLCSNQWLRGYTGRRYHIKEGLGSGGVGVVYKALVDEPDEIVAIKVHAPDLRFRNSPSMRERFEREIQRLQNLSGDFVVQIRDQGTVFGYPYYVMDYCDGGSLRDQVNTLSIEEKLSVIIRIAKCIDYIHSMNIVHRDLKLDNIMFKGGRALISDLGGARSVLAEYESLTETGNIIGSKDYMSPEQRKNPKYVTKATDYFSLGVVLYKLSTGELPTIGGFSHHLNNIIDQEVRDVVSKIARDLLSEDVAYRTRMWCPSIRDLNSLLMINRGERLP